MFNVLECLAAFAQLRPRLQALHGAVLVLLVAFAGPIAAQSGAPSQADPAGSEPRSITSMVIAGGGTTTARSSCFELAGTIAQSASGQSQGATYALTAGFWGPPRGTDTLFRSSFEACQP